MATKPAASARFFTSRTAITKTTFLGVLAPGSHRRATNRRRKAIRPPSTRTARRSPATDRTKSGKRKVSDEPFEPRANMLPYESPDVADNAMLDGKIADKAVSVMNEVKDKPFFLAVGFHKPHMPWVAPKKYWDMYQDSDIRLGRVSRAARRRSRVRQQRSRRVPQLQRHPERRRDPRSQAARSDPQLLTLASATPTRKSAK